MREQHEPIRGLSMDEQETVVIRTRTGEWTVIESTIPVDITVLRRNPRAEQVESGYFGSTEWAKFRVPSSEWNPARGIKRTLNLTEEQRKAAGARLREAQERRS